MRACPRAANVGGVHFGDVRIVSGTYAYLTIWTYQKGQQLSHSCIHFEGRFGRLRYDHSQSNQMPHMNRIRQPLERL